MRDAERAFDWLDMHLRALGRDVEREDGSRHVRYARGGEVFAIVRALKSRVDVGFDRPGRARSRRIRSARVAKLPHVRYMVRLEHPGDVDTELLAWLEESYTLRAADTEKTATSPEQRGTAAHS